MKTAGYKEEAKAHDKAQRARTAGVKKALRDMSEKQFNQALARHGMKRAGVMGYVEMFDGQLSVSMLNANTENRRARLAYLLARQEEEASVYEVGGCDEVGDDDGAWHAEGPLPVRLCSAAAHDTPAVSRNTNGHTLEESCANIDAAAPPAALIENVAAMQTPQPAPAVHYATPAEIDDLCDHPGKPGDICSHPRTPAPPAPTTKLCPLCLAVEIPRTWHFCQACWDVRKAARKAAKTATMKAADRKADATARTVRAAVKAAKKEIANANA